MINEKFFNDLREKIQPYFEEDFTGHGFDHTKRVYNNAVKLAKGEKVDLDILKAAALLHDVARALQEKSKIKICHAEFGADFATRILIKTKFPKEKINAVSQAILVHRKSKNKKLDSIEAEILRDADNLDSTGAISILRIFQHSKRYEKPVFLRKIDENGDYFKLFLNFVEKNILNKLNPINFNTQRAKQLSILRYNLVNKFIIELKQELL